MVELLRRQDAAGTEWWSYCGGIDAAGTEWWSYCGGKMPPVRWCVRAMPR